MRHLIPSGVFALAATLVSSLAFFTDRMVINDYLLSIAFFALLFLTNWRLSEYLHNKPEFVPVVDTMPRYHLMLDIETMGLHPGSQIRSVGVVRFDVKTGAVLENFYIALDLGSQAEYGLYQDASTVKWWTEQPQEAQLAFRKSVPIYHGLEELSLFLARYQDHPVWALGSYFDFSLLSFAYKVVGLKYPIEHRMQHCMRSINLTSDLRWSGKTPHHALRDAERQSQVLCEALSRTYVQKESTS